MVAVVDAGAPQRLHQFGKGQDALSEGLVVLPEHVVVAVLVVDFVDLLAKLQHFKVSVSHLVFEALQLGEVALVEFVGSLIDGDRLVQSSLELFHFRSQE